MDSALLHDRSISSDVEDDIADYVGEKVRTEPLRLVVRSPAPIRQHAEEIAHAIRTQFDSAGARCRRRYHRRMRVGRTELWTRHLPYSESHCFCALAGDHEMIIATGEGLLLLGSAAAPGVGNHG